MFGHREKVLERGIEQCAKEEPERGYGHIFQVLGKMQRSGVQMSHHRALVEALGLGGGEEKSSQFLSPLSFSFLFKFLFLDCYNTKKGDQDTKWSSFVPLLMHKCGGHCLSVGKQPCVDRVGGPISEPEGNVTILAAAMEITRTVVRANGGKLGAFMADGLPALVSSLLRGSRYHLDWI